MVEEQRKRSTRKEQKELKEASEQKTAEVKILFYRSLCIAEAPVAREMQGKSSPPHTKLA